ncbi:MAG: hypothetical protein HYU36_10660 [Planctomycetes bacterium]|nr:hypothetical protein [Planctomycetota bacterium]
MKILGLSLESLRARPFTVLVPGACLLLLLFVLVERKELKRADVRSIIPPSLEGHEKLVRTAMGQEEIGRRASEALRSLGHDPEGFFYGLEVVMDEEAYEHLRSRHRPEEIESFAEESAPLVTWRVTFFRPRESLEQRERLTVILDAEGRLCGFQGYRYEPEELRQPLSAERLGEVRDRAAGWLKLPASSLTPVESLDLLGSGHERADAAWSVEGLSLGDARVVVSVRQRGEFLNFSKSILLPRDMSYLSYAWKDWEFWGAVSLAAPLAFVLGLCLARPYPDPAVVPFRLEPVLLGSLAAAAATCLVQSLALVPSHPLFAAAFAAALPFFAFLAACLVWTPLDPSRPPVGRWMRLGLITAVPLAFLIMSLACSATLFTGCAQVCTLVRYTTLPLVLFAILLGGRDPRFYAYALALAALSLMPHCVCDNFINHCWIQWIGVSPMCYFFSFCVTLVSILGLCGIRPRLCAFASTGSALAVGLLGLGHQLLSFPW